MGNGAKNFHRIGENLQQKGPFAYDSCLRRARRPTVQGVYRPLTARVYGWEAMGLVMIDTLGRISRARS